MAKVTWALLTSLFISSLPISAQPLGAVCPPPPTPAGWEDLHVVPGDYRKMRGLCYFTAIDGLDIRSPTGMWNALAQKFCDPTAPNYLGPDGLVSHQLDMMKGIGVNTIRVWLSYPLWKFYDEYPPSGCTGNPAVGALLEFMALCESKQMYVMLVVWDKVGPNDPARVVTPPNAEYWGNAYEAAQVIAELESGTGFHQSPGCIVIGDVASPTLTLPPAPHPIGRYLDAVFDAVVDSDAFLMWDLFNEPALDAIPRAECQAPPFELCCLGSTGLEIVGDDYYQFIAATAAHIDNRYSSLPSSPCHPQTVGYANWGGEIGGRSGTINSSKIADMLDVLSLHEYTPYREGLETQIDLARTAGANLAPNGKAIIVTEIGASGWGQAYEDQINFCLRVPRPDLGYAGVPNPQTTGVGFMIWGAMLHDTVPFALSDGMFYVDGEVRSAAARDAYIDAALRQGHTPPAIATPALLPREKDYVLPPATQNPPIVPQCPMNVGADTYAFISSRLRDFAGTVEDAQVVYWYHWAHQTREMLLQLHQNNDMANGAFKLRHIENYMTQRAAGSFDEPWRNELYAFPSEGMPGYTALPPIGTLPETAYLAYVLGKTWCSFNEVSYHLMMTRRQRYASAAEPCNLDNPDIGVLDNNPLTPPLYMCTTTPFAQEKVELENIIATMLPVRNILLNNSPGHVMNLAGEAQNYFVPSILANGAAANHGPYVWYDGLGTNENLVRNPRALWFRHDRYKFESWAVSGSPLDGPIGKSVYGWDYTPDMLGVSDPIVPLLYAGVTGSYGAVTLPLGEPASAFGDYYFSRNTPEEFTATQSVFITDLWRDGQTLPPNTNLRLSGYFWGDVWLEVDCRDSTGAVLGHAAVIGEPGGSVPVYRDNFAAPPPIPATTVELLIKLRFASGQPGVGGADRLHVGVGT
ncbi:MAG: hypothetical protein AAF628_03115 [Planctomycetota bacterium]